MSVSLSTFTEVALVNTTSASGIIVVPPANSIPYRVVVFKDRLGTFQTNSLTLSTQGGNTFEDDTTTKIVNTRFGFISLYSDGVSKWHTLNGSQLVSMNISSLIVSTIQGNGSQLTNVNAISTLSLVSSLVGLGTLGYVSTASLTSTVQGLGSANYVSTLSLVSTTQGLQTGYATAGFLSTANLISTVQGLGSAGYVSTTALGAYFSSVSTSYAVNFITSSLTFSTATGSNATISSVTANQILFGTGNGWIQAGAIQATVVSSVQINTNVLYANSNFFGTVSSQTALQFYGLQGNYNNTVIAEQSTGTGTQELLLFKGSSASDQVRIQTTGGFRLETGVSSRLWPTYTQAVNPALYVDINSNVGIGTASPAALLDVVGQGRFQVVSTLQLNISSINGATFGSPINSTVIGLGSAGYVSTLSLVSTTQGLQRGYQTAGFLSTANLTSTVEGLGSANYISTLSLTSTALGLGTLGYISSLSSLRYSTGTLSLSSLILQDGNNSNRNTLQVSSGVLLFNTSTLIGLYASSYVSQGRLTSNQTITPGADNTITFAVDFDPQGWYNTGTYRFAPSIPGYYYLSFGVWWNNGTTNQQDNVQARKNGNTFMILQNPIATGTSGISASGSKLIYLNGVSDYVDFTAYTANATSQILQYGTATGSGTWFSAYLLTGGGGGSGGGGQVNTSTISEQNLTSTVVGLGTVGYISTTQLISTTAGILGSVVISGVLSTANLTSSVQGLGSANYVSTLSLVSTTQGLQTGYQTAGFLSTANLTSTVQGLGSANYISSSQLVSTTQGLTTYISSFIDPTELASTVIGLGTAGFISSIGLDAKLASTTQGLGTAGYISSSQLISTVAGLNTYASSFIDTTELNSTVRGLGTSGYVSTLSLVSTTQGLQIGYQTAGFLSTANLTSTVQGLGSAAYISSSQLQSTSIGLNNKINSISTTTAFSPSAYVVQGSVPTFQTIPPARDVILGFTVTGTPTNTSNYDPQGWWNPTTSTVMPTVAGYYLTSLLVWWSTNTTPNQASNNGQLNIQIRLNGNQEAISQAVQLSTIGSGLSMSLTSLTQMNGISDTLSFTVYNGNPGYSTQVQPNGTFFNTMLILTGDANYTAGFISTATLNAALTSTLAGLGTAGYISSSQLISTVAGLTTYASSFIDITELNSTVQGLGSANYVSTLSLVSTTQGLQRGYQTAGFLSTANLTSTVQGLGSANYVSTLSLVSTTQGLQNSYATAGFLSTANLTSTVAGLGTAGYLSTTALGPYFSSVSTSYALSFTTSSLIFSTATGSTATISSLAVNQLTFGTGSGWLQFGAVQAVAVSSIQLNTNSLYANSNFFGTVSSQTALQFYGLQGNYNNTVIAEQSTGTGTQELLLFKGSSASDQVRIQTTGGFRLETGVSSRLWPTYAQTANPAFYVDINSNVGIGTASPGALLDVVGQGRFQVVSTLQLNISSINGATFGSPINSTVIGLGSAGYVSTLSLVSTTAGILANVSVTGVLSTANLTSTVQGLGSANYVSTLSLVSTTQGLQTGYQTAGFLSTANLTSTVQGLGSAGYISSSQLISTVAGLNTYTSSFIDAAELTSTISSLGTLGYVSTLSLVSTTQGLQTGYATAGFLSTANLTSTVAGLGTAGYVSTLSLVSTTAGILANVSVTGVLSTANLTSTVQGLGSANYVSTLSLVSTTQGLQNSYATAGFLSTANLTSTVAGLGSAGYLSTTALGPYFSSLSTSYALSFTTSSLIFSTATGSNATISSVTANQILFGTGNGWIQAGAIQATVVSSVQINTNVLYANSNFFGTVSSQTALQFYGLQGNYNNTVIAEQSTGTGTQELLLFKGSSASDQVRIQTTGGFRLETGVSSRLWPTYAQTANPAFYVDINSNVGIGTASPGALLDVVGQGRFQVVSTLQLNISSINGATFGSPINSTVIGLGSAGYVSTLSLVSTTAGIIANISVTGVLSTANLTSTVQGLGSAGYISSSQLVSTTQGLTTYISSFIDPAELTSTVVGLGTVGFISSIGFDSKLASTVQGLGTAGYVSSSQLVSTTASLANTIASGFSTLSTAIQLTPGYNAQILYLNQSVDVTPYKELGAYQVVAPIQSTITSLPGNTNSNLLASFQTDFPLPSFIPAGIWDLNIFADVGVAGAVTFFFNVYSRNGGGSETLLFVSQPAVVGNTGIYQYTASAPVPYTNIASGNTLVLKLYGSNSTSPTRTFSNFYQNIYYSHIHTTFSQLGDTGSSGISSLSTVVSYGLSSIALFTSNTSNYFSSQIVSTNNNLISTVAGLGSANYVSTLSLVSMTQGLQTGYATAGFLSTPNLTSTVQGLGTAGYLSSTALGPYFSSLSTSYALNFITSSLTFSTATGSNATISTVTTNQLTVGSNGGWLLTGAIQTAILSSVQINTNLLYTNSNFFGTVSSQTALQFYGLQGNYNNTVIAEQSTGTGTQELLLFKGSSASDQVRIQTTGGFRLETGVSSRLWPTYAQAANPALYVDINSNVGIGTASPGALLDVVGQGRFQVVSTLQLNISSINGATFGSPINSTVIGLGSAGYVSTLSLVSTTAGILANFSITGVLSTANLTSTVAGLGSAGYISSSQLISTVAGLNTYTSSFIDAAELTSTISSLGTLGYVSTLSLVSTTQGLQTGYATAGFLSTANLTSTVQGLGSANYVSTLSLVSTTAGILANVSITGVLSTANLTSTVQGLGSSGYISSFQNILSISSQQIVASSIGIGCNAPFYTLDINGSAHATVFSSVSLLTSSFFGTLADATTVVVYDV